MERMADSTYDNVTAAIKKLQVLRANVASLYCGFESGTINNPNGDSNENSEELNFDFFASAKKKLEKIGQSSIELEKSLGSIQAPSLPFTPGPVALLASDPSLDQSQLSQHVMQTYKWFSKMHEQSLYAHNIASIQASKKSLFNLSLKRSKKSNPAYLATSSPQLENLVIFFQRSSGLNINIVKPTSSNPLILEVTVGNILRALMVMRGLMVENVVIKSFHEDLKNKETGRYNHDSLSKFDLFRKITEHAKCFLISNNSDVRPFVSWLYNYKTLFTSPCSRCNKQLLDFSLPTFRDLRTIEPCHVSCYYS